MLWLHTENTRVFVLFMFCNLIADGKMSMVMNATLSADTSERFSTRVAEKFSFLGE